MIEYWFKSSGAYQLLHIMYIICIIYLICPLPLANATQGLFNYNNKDLYLVICLNNY